VVRTEKGRDILAACGQLRRQHVGPASVPAAARGDLP
jgi:adenine C2-methylase RlmN of 23S rRNA A2503 and tRNA A37